MNENPLSITIARITTIDKDETASMFRLHSSYFTNTTLQKFIADFQAKQWCIIIREPSGGIVGYSTIELIFPSWTQSPTLVLFSGDTLVGSAYRSANPLLPAFVQFSEYLEHRYPDHVRYWLLITKGYRTYRLLPVNYREFYPRHGVVVPADLRSFTDRLCTEKFGGRYDARSGIVRALEIEDFLKPEHAQIPEGRMAHRDVQFFLRTNPGFSHGDELVCLTPLTSSNLFPSLRRRYLSGRRAAIEE